MYFEFEVKSAKDAILLLAPDTKTTTKAIEIVIGGGTNTFSAIRDGKLGTHLNDERTKNRLSANDFRSFWIRYSCDVLEVGQRNETKPFLQYKPLRAQVHAIGFASWGENAAQWRFKDEFGLVHEFSTTGYKYERFTHAPHV